nr:MAG TPA: hypothetical protein [Caudoviricetes sp.]
MRVRAVPAANTAAPAINFLELRLIAGKTASLLNLNSTIFSLVSTEVSVVSVMRVSFQIEGSHIRHGFSRGKPIPQVRDIGVKSLGEALHSKLHELFINSVISECCVLFLELNNKTSVLFGLELLLFVSNSKPDGHNGDQSECNVGHCGSFLRVFNIPTDFLAESLYPMAGYKLESLLRGSIHG